MSIPATRDDFKAYCLRSLGEGVIQVNVTDDQLEDRIDEALYMFQQYHMDAVVKAYLPHELTPSVMEMTNISNTNVVNAGTDAFANGEYVQGQTSLAMAQIIAASNASSNLIYFTTRTEKSDANLENMTPGFTVGEMIVGQTTGMTANVANTTLGDFDRGWIPVVPAVVAVTKIFAPFDSRMSADILFDPQSQFNISLLSNFTSNSIIPYYVGRSYQQLLNDMFRGRPAIRFQRHQGRVYLDLNLYTTFRPGNYVIVECYRCIDPETYPLVWGDRWLQRYTIALMRRQWGNNLSKYNGITLPGGVTLDGKTMQQEAVQEIKDLEEELKSTYQEPIDFMVG
jgi:hypothetical protein